MRLIKLKLKNIASLKGEHLIEFDQITQSSSLFAITGETGSGKSSILNAIAMALYGRVYKTSVTQADIVTLGEREGQIQLIFSIRGEYYLADWKGRIRRPNGELLKKPTLDRVIQKISTDSFDGERSTETYQADDLLNLNFDQFCKCIILNQGEFAKFLSSSFTERKAILEKLYPGNDIENLSRFLKIELDEAKSKMSVLTTQLETLSFSPEEGVILSQQKEILTNELNLKNSWQKRYSALKRLFDSLEIYYKSFQDNQSRQTKLQTEIKETTHLFNLSMNETEKKRKDLLEITQFNDSRIPLLQELLKKEEQEKFLKNQIQLFENNLHKLLEQKKNILQQKEEVLVQQAQWSNIYQETIKSFNFDPDLLLSYRSELEQFADNMGRIEKLEIEKKNLKERFNEVEIKGKNLKENIQKLEVLMKEEPMALKEKINELKKQKNNLQEITNQREVQKKTLETLLLKEDGLNKELQSNIDHIKSIQLEFKENATLLNALEVSLTLHEYNVSLRKCADHGKSHNLDHCPLCEKSLEQNFWDNLKLKLSDTNIEEIQENYQQLNTKSNQLKNREILLLTKNEEITKNIETIKSEAQNLKNTLSKEIPDLKALEVQIEEHEKKLIHFEHQQKEMDRLNEEIKLIRTQYLQSKEALSNVESSLTPIVEENNKLKTVLRTIDLELETKLNKLKNDLRLLLRLTQEKKQGETLEQKLTHLQENLKNINLNCEDLKEKIKSHSDAREDLLEELKDKLQGKSSQEELAELQTRFKNATSEFQNAEAAQKKHEQDLSLKRGNISSIEQLLKDYELKFIETQNEIKTLSLQDISPLNDEIQSFEDKLKTINLTLSDSIEVIIASKSFISESLNEFETSLNKLNNELGVIKEKISHWDKTQDKIKLLKLEFEEANSKTERFKRLSSILGTDELRTFALSLVEENLILQTNEELANLCQSRYEIIHQSRRGITPEFYILDKFREGGIRKVSTLSGGETFMVSLAMALALAEMTRGQAEIDTLFIDEGFGTLDQESLEDVLDMLNQIQNRGLMIGIISHIKTLTQALGVNLLLSKGQDGTSKVSIRYN
ncbi:MAG: AAA family ATPase [Bacteriovoracaceae bacterium]